MFAQKNQTENPLLQVTMNDHVPPELAPEEVISPDPQPTQALPQDRDKEEE
jgi:hypothetical protein